MSRFIISLCLLGSLFVSPLYANEAEVNAPQHTIDINFPSEMDWTLVENDQDEAGYIKTYQPKEQIDKKIQSLIISYGRGLRPSLSESLRQVKNAMADVACRQKDVRVVKENSHDLTFAALLDDCANGRSMVQIFKVFNAKEGQYSIIYTVVPDQVDSSTIHTMQSVIESAVIAKALHTQS
jgi:hypothetical protein